jgi:hypothetical protein
MFTSLHDEMRHDDALATNRRERFLKWGTIMFGSVFLFSALFYAIRLFA